MAKLKSKIDNNNNTVWYVEYTLNDTLISDYNELNGFSVKSDEQKKLRYYDFLEKKSVNYDFTENNLEKYVNYYNNLIEDNNKNIKYIKDKISKSELNIKSIEEDIKSYKRIRKYDPDDKNDTPENDSSLKKYDKSIENIREEIKRLSLVIPNIEEKNKLYEKYIKEINKEIKNITGNETPENYFQLDDDLKKQIDSVYDPNNNFAENKSTSVLVSNSINDEKRLNSTLGNVSDQISSSVGTVLSNSLTAKGLTETVTSLAKGNVSDTVSSLNQQAVNIANTASTNVINNVMSSGTVGALNQSIGGMSAIVGNSTAAASLAVEVGEKAVMTFTEKSSEILIDYTKKYMSIPTEISKLLPGRIAYHYKANIKDNLNEIIAEKMKDAEEEYNNKHKKDLEDEEAEKPKKELKKINKTLNNVNEKINNFNEKLNNISKYINMGSDWIIENVNSYITTGLNYEKKYLQVGYDEIYNNSYIGMDFLAKKIGKMNANMTNKIIEEKATALILKSARIVARAKCFANTMKLSAIQIIKGKLGG